MQPQGVVIVGWDEVGRQRRRHYAWRHGEAEVAAKALHDHVVGVHLAVGTVTGDVGRAYPHAAQQLEVDKRLMLPRVNHGVAYLIIYYRVKQGVVVNHRSAARVDYERTAGEAAEERGVGQMERRMGPVLGQRHVEGDDVGLALDVGHRHKLALVAPLLPRRVAHHDAHAVTLGHGLYL